MNCIQQTVAQSVARYRPSEIRERISCELRPVLNIEVSSANIEHSLGIDRGRSLIYTRKRIGPRTIPCGMPDLGACHSDSLWHPLHTKEGDEISMFLLPCLQSSISTLSFSFLELFFCYAVSSCVYDDNHPYLASERLFLAEHKAFPYLRRALAHPRRALAIL